MPCGFVKRDLTCALPPQLAAAALPSAPGLCGACPGAWAAPSRVRKAQAKRLGEREKAGGEEEHFFVVP